MLTNHGRPSTNKCSNSLITIQCYFRLYFEVWSISNMGCKTPPTHGFEFWLDSTDLAACVACFPGLDSSRAVSLKSLFIMPTAHFWAVVFLDKENFSRNSRVGKRFKERNNMEAYSYVIPVHCRVMVLAHDKRPMVNVSF
jgi:hypothetical protein